MVPQRTLDRYALEVLGHGRASRRGPVPVADCGPGAELQADFGGMGLPEDLATERRRVTQAPILTAVVFAAHVRVPDVPPAPGYGDRRGSRRRERSSAVIPGVCGRCAKP